MADPLRPTPPGTYFTFGDLVLDGARYELRRGGERVAIQRKPLLLLLYLVQHTDRLVSTAELTREIWGGVAVTDASLRNAVKVLRRTIGPSAGIESVRGLGYRFVVPAPLDGRDSVPPPPSGDLASGSFSSEQVVTGPAVIRHSFSAAGVSGEHAAQEPASGRRRRAPGEPLGPPSSSPVHRSKPRRPGGFVGRSEELGGLERALDRALLRDSRTTMVVGTAGIGKTRLIREFSNFAQRRSVRVVIGQCSEGQGCPGFWPWGPILEQLALEGLRVPLEADSAVTRFRLFADIVEMLRRRSEQEPLLLVLEDLHWAREPALLLLQFVVEQLQQARVMILGSYREGDLEPSDACTRVIGIVQGRGQLVLMRPLAEADVTELLASESTLPVTPELVSTVLRWTGGNPLFVHELIPLLEHQGESTSVARTSSSNEFDLSRLVPPAGVQEVIRAQLRPLGEGARRVLSTCALLGAEFELSLLMQVETAPANELSRMLKEATTRRVLYEVSAGSYRFAHALIQDALASDLAPLDRAALHARIAEVLENSASAETIAAVLAHHYAQALPVLPNAEKPIRYALAAARSAMSKLAYEQARDHALTALSLADRVRANLSTRTEILKQLGEAQRYCGATEDAKATFVALARLGREANEPRILVEGALGYGRAHTENGLVDQTLVALLSDGLKELPPDEDVLRAESLARLGLALQFDIDADRRLRTSQEGVALARSCGHDQVLAVALQSLVQVTWGSRHIELRRSWPALIDEGIASAHACGDLELLCSMRIWRVACHLENAELQESLIELNQYTQLADQLGNPKFVYFARLSEAALALLNGRLSEARNLSRRAFDAGHCVGRVATSFQAVQDTIVRRDAGDLADLVPKVPQLAAMSSSLVARRSVAAVILAAAGDHQAATTELDALINTGLSRHRFDPNWLPWYILASHAATDVGHRTISRELFVTIEPFQDLSGVCGSVCAVFGTTALALGVLATQLGELDTARRHLHRALITSQELAARPEQARTELALARLAFLSGQTETALAACSNAEHLAKQVGMKRLLLDVVELKRRLEA